MSRKRKQRSVSPVLGTPAHLDLGDALCHICLGILIEPVTMPCKHTMCYVCFTRTMEINSLNCPMCKKRIGTWARRCSKQLVDTALWRRIQDTFPDRVALRQQGIDEDPDDLEELFPCVTTHMWAETGSIREEFQREVDMERESRAKAENEEASEELVRALQREEEEAAAKKKSSNSQTLALSSSQKEKSANRSIRDMMIAASPKPSTSKIEVEPMPSTSSDIPAIPTEVLSTFTDADMESQLNAFKRFEQEQRDQEMAERLARSPSSGAAKNKENGSTPTRGSPRLKAGQTTPRSSVKKRGMKQLSLKETFQRHAV